MWRESAPSPLPCLVGGLVAMPLSPAAAFSSGWTPPPALRTSQWARCVSQRSPHDEAGCAPAGRRRSTPALPLEQRRPPQSQPLQQQQQQRVMQTTMGWRDYLPWPFGPPAFVPPVITPDVPAVVMTDCRRSFTIRERKRKGKTLSSKKVIPAMDGVSLTVHQGEIFGLLGPNACGKTTTLRCLSTLDRPDSGGIQLFGLDARAHPDIARQVIGVVEQSAGVDKVLTGREHLELFAGLNHIPRDRATRNIAYLIRVLHLEEFIDRQTGTYSGGVIRRLDIALGLLNNPGLLILDEPTVGLDLASRTVIWDVLRAVRDAGGTIILTSHYLEEVEYLADRVAIMDRGTILAVGTPSSLKSAVGGTRVTIRLEEFTEAVDARRVAAALVDRGVASSAVVNEGLGNAIEAVVPGVGGDAVNAVVNVVRSTGWPEMFGFSHSRPSLGDVYLQATGSVLGEADRAAKASRNAAQMRKESMR